MISAGTGAGVAVGVMLTPGPNMVYLVSRSITQGCGVLALRLATEKSRRAVA